MNSDAGQSHGFSQRFLDGSAAALLVFSLAGVCLWDRSLPTTNVISGASSPSLLTYKSGAEPFVDTMAEVAATSESASPVAESEAGAPASVPPVEEVHKPASDFVPRANIVTSMAVPQPEPPPVVAQRFLSQPNLNQFGNPEGQGYGLARRNEFANAKILVWTTLLEAQENIFTDDNPLWAALKDLGFEIELKRSRFQAKWLEDVDQLWILSDRVSGLDAESFAAVLAFVKDGKGLYLAAENAPFYAEATQLTQSLYRTSISGNYPGQNVIAVRGHGITRDDFRKFGKDVEVKEKGDVSDTKTRLEIISRATHYVDEHPLLTDVNFIYEGITISHIAPTPQLQTVLTAFDGQILAAVSLDPGQRVVVDCGYTRYFYSPNARYVTDTAGTIRYAEIIAAYLMGKNSKGEPGGVWQERKRLLQKYRDASPDQLAAAFQHVDVAERLAAVTMASRRKLPLFDEFVELTRDTDPNIRRLARAGLVNEAGSGIDYGPLESATDGDCEVAHRNWSGWLRRKKLLAECQSKNLEQIVTAMKSDDAEKRWAAVSAANSRRLDCPDALIELLADAEPAISELSRQALIQLAGKSEFAPARDTVPEASTDLIVQWKRWRAVMKHPGLGAAKNDDLIAAMKAPDMEHRWAAVIVARQKRLRLVTHLIDSLNDREKLIRREARLALVQLAKSSDFGPGDDALEAEVAKSVRNWKEWWRLDLEKSASSKLTLAKPLLKNNPEAARQRLNEIIDQFPTTNAAKEAERILQGL